MPRFEELVTKYYQNFTFLDTLPFRHAVTFSATSPINITSQMIDSLVHDK